MRYWLEQTEAERSKAYSKRATEVKLNLTIIRPVLPSREEE
jgi:hypothetical protein